MTTIKPAVEAARLAVLSKLEQLLPGDGKLVVDVQQRVRETVFCCARSTRLGLVCLTVPSNLDDQTFVTRALEELADTQLDALEALSPPPNPMAEA